ncbi:Ig-like domain-containing protein [Christiangramia sabulilitoris]|uniref:Ig-like domain-containing protein n=1 Tax=Christiangramia sabulilitoris TaxID=2583991 RepID=UPI0014082A9A|nr:Ig-like domain-containing protein [Christiangramia sabulilitoris]
MTILLLSAANSLYAQQGDPSNFSIRGNVYSGVPSSSPTADDWFQGPTANGIIDESNTAAYQAINSPTIKNQAFRVGSKYPQYEEVGGYILYDAVYGRDHVDLSNQGYGRDRTAFTGSSGKNGDNPNLTWATSQNENVPDKSDIVDAYAHLRRAGLTIGQNMWLNMGVSTLSNSGDHFLDFELYAQPIETNGTNNGFVNAGENNTGGHTPWVFDASGNVTRSGDMIAGFSFNGSTVSNVILRIWTKRTTWQNVTPANFNWGPNFDGSGTNSEYGYAEIIIPSGSVFSTGNSSQVTGPPWGTFYSNSNPYTTNYDPGYFAEVGLNLSKLGIDPSLSTGNACDAPFTKLLVKSRSSSSFTSNLKDFAGPYDFLGASYTDTRIKRDDPGYIICGNTTLGLSPLVPDPAAYYRWTTVDGEFSNGQKTFIGMNAVATKPGTYRLSGAPLEGCTETFNETVVYAQPCANFDEAEVVENRGPVVIDVVANDTDLDNNIVPGSVSVGGLSINAQNGTLSVDPVTGAISYTPNPGFFGVDTFEYEVFDATPSGTEYNGPLSDIALVTVTVLKDSDNDTVPDRDDIDDDNDGIPDTIEQPFENSQPVCGSNTVLNFSSPTKLSGNNNSRVGDEFLFTNVAPGIEAVVIITGFDSNKFTLSSIDDDGTNSGSFKPVTELRNMANGEQGYVEFTFRFYESGTSQTTSPVPVSVPEFLVNYNDIDGSSFYSEQNWVYFPDSYTIETETEILINRADPWIIAQGGETPYSGSGNGNPNINLSAKFTDLSVFRVRLGVVANVSFVGSTTITHNLEFDCVTNFVNPKTLDSDSDKDSDLVPNYLDLDADNDGIPDVREAGYDDPNNDGMLSGPYGTNGLADSAETFPDSGILAQPTRNTDQSAEIDPELYDFLDVDSDNDGLTDAYEAFSNNSSHNDNDHDGIIDGFTDNNKNGWHDPLDALPSFPVIRNSDYDPLPDYLDLDSDGDGIPDTYESNSAVIDADNDGIVGEGIPADSDGDGLADTNDPDNAGNVLGGNEFLLNRDFDNLGLPNHLDIDTDNDGIIDNVEAQSTFAYVAPSGNDTDGDGIDDAYDVNNGGVGIGYVNTDGGTEPDFADTNSEDDGSFDIIENHIDNTSDFTPFDQRNNQTGSNLSDGMIDPGVADDDGDGLSNVFDLVNGTNSISNVTNSGQTPLTQPDNDPVGGDRDWREKSEQDNDNDGISDFYDLDDDNDGILDTDELDGIIDLDGDGLQNSFDLDSDADGLPDHLEGGGIFDQDGNGTPGSGLLGTADVDSQGVPLQVSNRDGGTYPTQGLVTIDTDGDSYMDYRDLDSDNDGIADVIEAGGEDPEGNGVYGAGNANDEDADGLADVLDIIFNNDVTDPTDSSVIVTNMGTPMGGTPLTMYDSVSGIHKALDSDGDGIADYLDLDSDNDTTPDNIEGQTTLGYVAFAASDTDGDGIVDSYDYNQGNAIFPVDTDGDGTPDYLDLDSDDDTKADIIEANTVVVSNTGGRTNNPVGSNGLDNNYDGTAGDTYADPNGIYDNTQADNFPDEDDDVYAGGDVDYRDTSFNDNDNDGIVDSVDLDDDNDGVLDTAESYGADPAIDSDNDGIPNYMDPDHCSGDINSFGICSDYDLDNDGIPNHFDLESDGDGCSDAIEAGATSDPTSDYKFPASPVGTDGIPDDVQVTSGANSGNVDYTVSSLNPPVYDFLDADVFVACKADLSLVKTVDNANPTIGDVITFTLTLTNSGPFSVSQVQVQDNLPAGLLNITGTPSSGTFDPTTGIWDLTGITIDPASPGNVVSLQITAEIGPNCGAITNTAEIITSERADPDSTPGNGL